MVVFPFSATRWGCITDGTAPIQVVQYAKELFEFGDRHKSLKTHISDYEKGATRAFSITRERLNIARQRAQALAAKFNARSDPEPFTAIVDLVELLTQLRSVK